MGCHFLLQGIVPTQGSKLCLLCLLHWQMDSLPTEPSGTTGRILTNQDPMAGINFLSCLPKKAKSLSRVRLFATPWTVAHQSPPSMEFFRQEYWSGCHFLLQGIFPTRGSNLGLPHCRQTLYRLSHQGIPSSLPTYCQISCECLPLTEPNEIPKGRGLFQTISFLG